MREKDMGSPGSGAADCTVGSIVWVRRRNGSWWPGKILGQEDLDSTHITSPRSGTPVKLLGREDASVDWYNLEKSKRVKPFRCGDFDECIERVESTQGLTIRKREKYARREDAILHALELEKEMMKKEGKLLLVPEKANGTREALGLNHVVGDDDVVVMHLVKDKEEEDQPSCDDEAVPRMRGLQDFGLKTASSKRKFSSFNGLDNASFKSLARSNSPASSSGDHSMDRPIYALGKENARSTMEAKRTKYMFTPNETNDVLDLHESLLSHRDAMRTSSTFPADSRYSLPGYDPPEFLEDVETDSEESETETSDMEEDTDDDIPLVSGSARHSEQQRNTFSRHMSGDDESTSSEDEEKEDLYESSMSGDSSYLNETGTVSKWQLKGKRNMRNLPRRSTRKREMHRSSSNRLEDGRYCEYKRRGFNQLGFSDDGTDDDTDPRLGDDDDDYRIPNMITSGCNNNNKNIFSHEMLDWDDDPWEGRIGKKRSEEEKIVDRKTYSPLMDVELEVRGSYTKGPVPIVSLMSKLNGRAIIGHPVEIEILPDGSSDSFDYFGGNETTYHDKPFLLPPAWKTARRSNSRVPRLHPFSSSVDGEDDDHHHHSPVRKKKLGIGNLMRIPRPPGDRKHYPQHQHHHQQLIPPQQQQKKFVKNANTSASQKTRALSSFSSEQGGGHQNSGMKALNREQLSNNSRRVVLPGPPTVACIPVKLVFSRLLEKINRPASVKGFNERRRDLHQ